MLIHRYSFSLSGESDNIFFFYKNNRNLNDYLACMPLSWPGTPFTRKGCSKSHHTCPSTPLGMGHPQVPWQSVPVSPHPLKEDVILKSKSALFSFSLKLFPLILSLHTF